MESRITILCLMCTSFLLTLSSGEVRVTPKLYGTAELPCTFPFIRGLEDLTVVWEKVEDTGRRFLVHKSVAGRDDLSDQDSQYSGRTRLSGGVMNGNLQLTLTEATLRDEGTYYCRAANRKGHGDKKVELSIAGLNATDPTVTLDSDSQRLMCIAWGNFRDPKVKWYDRAKRDLSSTATLNVTDIHDGWKKVESVLEYEVDKREHYFCHMEEEGLKTNVIRAVISDGVNPVSVNDEL